MLFLIIFFIAMVQSFYYGWFTDKKEEGRFWYMVAMVNLIVHLLYKGKA